MEVPLLHGDASVDKEQQESRLCLQATPVGFRACVWAILVLVADFLFHERSKHKARCLLCATLAVSFIATLLTLWSTSFVRRIQNALQSKDEGEFYRNMYLSGAAILVTSVFSLLQPIVFGTFAIEWRKTLTTEMLSDYFGASQAYYRFQIEAKDIDNPDERIGQDVGFFTVAAVRVIMSILTSLLTIVGSSYAIYSISPALTGLGLAYATFSVIATSVPFARCLVTVQRDMRAREASFRYNLVRAREHAESIAFFRGEGYECDRCASVFGSVVEVLYRNLFLETGYRSLTSVFSAMARLIPMWFLSPRYFNGDIQLGDLHQAQALFLLLMGSLAAIFENIDTVASLGAAALRVQQMRSALAECRRMDEAEDGAILFRELPVASAPSGSQEPQLADRALCLQISSLSLCLPSDAKAGVPAPLLQGLSLTLSAGESLLVMGESGLGKSTLLRAMAGLWSSGAGSIECCDRSEVFFLPQVPYLCLGSLRANLLYPRRPAHSLRDAGASASRGRNGEAVPTDPEITAALEMVNAGHLAVRHGMDSVADFARVLSEGEKQRLSFARLLLQRGVRLAVLDEATSALDDRHEARMYTLLRESVPCHISVGHRPALEQFHSRRLTFTRHVKGGSVAAFDVLGAGVTSVVSVGGPQG